MLAPLDPSLATTSHIEPAVDGDELAASDRAVDDVVDVADTASWPVGLHELIAQLAEVTELADSVVDLREPEEADARVRACLAERRLLAFHATRLLDHEREMINSAGLRTYGRDLFDDKIHAAFEHGAIDHEQRDALLAGHMGTGNEPKWRGKRKDQVCVILGRSVFDQEPLAVHALLSNWGGEGIYFASGTQALKPILQRLGAPAIIAVAIPVEPSWRTQYCAPGLSKAFLGTFFGMSAHADVFHPANVAAQDIRGIWQPGHPEYDRHTQLPTS